jgi:hypothetical protein
MPDKLEGEILGCEPCAWPTKLKQKARASRQRLSDICVSTVNASSSPRVEPYFHLALLKNTLKFRIARPGSFFLI